MADKQFDLAIIVSSKVQGAVSGLGSLGKTLGTLGIAAAGMGTAVVGGLGVVAAGVTKLAVDAAPLGGIKKAFEGISEASGKSSKDMIAALQKGSIGMMTQRDLMKSYNLAASLVGDQFANQLPEAMGYLSKVAAGTGEDMGYMMDSLVRGIGRLSPMILDNLGIQVSLSEAYEAFAPTINKTVGELTKQEQQIALTNQVMEKLAANTANMPEVAGSAAAGIAGLKAKFADLKDLAGLHLLPALENILGILLKAAEKVFPYVEVAAEKLGVVLEKWTADLGTWFDKGAEGLGGLFEEIGIAIEGGWPGISAKLVEWGNRFWDWIKETVLPLAVEKLGEITIEIGKWIESESTQTQLATFGESLGSGLVDGFHVLVGAEETWTVVLADMIAALMKSAIKLIPMTWSIGGTVAKGFISGLIDELNLSLPPKLQDTISKIFANILRLGPVLGPLATLLGFQTGGMMPGAPSQAGLALLHGGERVIPAGGQTQTDQLLGRILGALERLISKDTVVVVETARGGTTRDHLLGLADQSYSLLPTG